MSGRPVWIQAKAPLEVLSAEENKSPWVDLLSVLMISLLQCKVEGVTYESEWAKLASEKVEPVHVAGDRVSVCMGFKTLRTEPPQVAVR